jgi:HlyD family secretion protein
MDIPRKNGTRNRRLRLTLYAVLGPSVVVLITIGLARLKPAAPSVDGATVWIDAVKRGPMDLQVRGLGKLVAETVQWIPAPSNGQVMRRPLLPGTAVKADTVLLVLGNRELQQSALDAEWQLKAAEADLQSLKPKLERELLDEKATAATVQADYHEAKIQADVDERLAKSGLAAELKAELSAAKAEQLATRKEIEQQRLGTYAESVQTQLAAQQAKIKQLRALYELKQSQVNALNVRAGISGVLQEVSVQIGQQVTPGTTLAKVVDRARLKAELKIPETQAKDIQVGQAASIDTHNGLVVGRVSSIDPAVQEGTVIVDVALEGTPPRGARPDLSVEGSILIDHFDDVVYVGRPAFGQPNSSVGLFRLGEGGKEAVRVQVKLGRASVNAVHVLEGLKVGEEVIFSDMSRWDGFERVRLE